MYTRVNNIQGVPKKISYFFRVFVSKVGITEFPELLGELAFSRIFIVRFHGFSCFFINFKFSGGLLIFDETNEMHRKDQVFVRPLRWTKVFYEA